MVGKVVRVPKVKFNQNHDERGRFAPAEGGGDSSSAGGSPSANQFSSRYQSPEKIMSAKIVGLKKLGNDQSGINVTYKGKMVIDGAIRPTFVKPIDRDYGPDSTVGVEGPANARASVLVAQAMGVDSPPAVVRDVPGHGPSLVEEGALGTVAMDSNATPNEDEMNRLALFDHVIGNADRHDMNYLVQDSGHVVAIDQDMSFGQKPLDWMDMGAGQPINYPLNEKDVSLLKSLDGNTALDKSMADVGLGSDPIRYYHERIKGILDMNERQKRVEGEYDGSPVGTQDQTRDWQPSPTFTPF